MKDEDKVDEKLPIAEDDDAPKLNVGLSVDKTGPETSVSVNVGVSIPFWEGKPIC